MVLLGMFAGGQRHVEVELGNWVALPDAHSGEHFHFHLKFVFDRLSVPFTILTFALVGTIGVFANRYLHRDRGFNRFFLLYAFFLMGMVAAALAGTIETLFLGWELVGLVVGPAGGLLPRPTGAGASTGSGSGRSTAWRTRPFSSRRSPCTTRRASGTSPP